MSGGDTLNVPPRPSLTKGNLSGKTRNLKFMRKKEDAELQETLAANRMAKQIELANWASKGSQNDGIMVIEDDIFPTSDHIWARRSFGGFNPKQERGAKKEEEPEVDQANAELMQKYEEAEKAWAFRYRAVQSDDTPTTTPAASTATSAQDQTSSKPKKKKKRKADSQDDLPPPPRKKAPKL
eukprot:NODE_9077_length_664_cov_27.190388_g8813_i0.p1 GENE.NODE_9077_length_664_cov_27.190388_g8813_i0~~NODE_9077_length_664_cov_27.190388_g8813_i0.p1  ORF type:complete len:205 (-),score=62.17 NODE_9077_length_664_cov_27.190388_g8813_i0:50-595(-)